MDEAARELVRDWLTRASHDLQAARTLAAGKEPLLDTAIYHCQQAAEKAVKGWLQSQDNPFPKTHDIEELVAHAAKLHGDFNQFAKAAVVRMNRYRRPRNLTKPCNTPKPFTISC